MLAVVTMRRTGPHRPGDSPVDAAGFLARLPRGWATDLRQVPGYLALRVRTEQEIGLELIREVVVAALGDPEQGHWRLIGCQALGGGASVPRPAVPVGAAGWRSHLVAEWN
ncbi:hypothetical protein Sru01_21300 [Sphaerisporangium rufum]|uniref:Uncharacterized protein n=1 Tax=Sphaerisporangium rufum TaxID=1381558 RepID=A0A919R0K1_9ACTN|nr:hypothetical protein [Sphaerisporangium rufum]GII77148.1 hypothetical protein Sru01_21300 [Sphaerisporangium rufum]